MKNMKKSFCEHIKRILINNIDSSLYNLHGYELNVKKVKKALPKSFNNTILTFCPVYAWTENKSAYFVKDKKPIGVPILELELVEEKLNTFTVILNYDARVIDYIKDFFSIRELLKLYIFLLRTQIKQWISKHLDTLALIVAMITSVISIFLGIKSQNTPQEINVRVQIEQTVPQSQSEPITPENSTATVPMINL